jgi:transposase
MSRKPYPSDVTDDEWAFIAPYLTLMKEDAPQRDHPLREVFNGLRWIVRTGAQWRMLPNDLPPWHTVYQQAQRWIAAGVFEEMVHDLRVLQSFLMVAPFNLRRKVANERATTDTNERKEARSILRWIR